MAATPGSVCSVRYTLSSAPGVRSTCTGCTVSDAGAAWGVDATTATLVAKPASRASDSSAPLTSAARRSRVVVSAKWPSAVAVTSTCVAATRTLNRPFASVVARAVPAVTTAPAMGACDSASMTTPLMARSVWVAAGGLVAGGPCAATSRAGTPKLSSTPRIAAARDFRERDVMTSNRNQERKEDAFSMTSRASARFAPSQRAA